MKTHLLSFVLPLAFLLLTLAGCGDDRGPASACTERRDCEAGEVCTAGTCQPGTCRANRECNGGFVCSGGRCLPPDDLPDEDVSEEDATEDDVDAGDTDDVSDDPLPPEDVDVDETSDPEADTEDATDTESSDADAGDTDTDDTDDVVDAPLMVVGSVPEDGASGVSLGIAVRITFNQPVDPTTLTPTALTFGPAVGTTLERTVRVDPDDPTTIVIDPVNPQAWLTPLEAYRVRLQPEIRAASGRALPEQTDITFSARAPAGEAFRSALARHYAPTLFLEVENEAIDTFTRFDFGGASSTAGNLGRAQTANRAQEAWVYYTTQETATHWYITYTLYFPGGTNIDRTGDPFEHQFLNAMVIVKRTGSEFGRFQALSTLWDNYDSAWVLDAATYARFGDDAVTTRSGGLSQPGARIRGTLPGDSLEEDRSVQLFIPAGYHTICPLVSSTLAAYPCPIGTGTARPFRTSENIFGRVFRAGDTASAPLPRTRGDDFTYRLIPLDAQVWPRRHLTGQDGFFSNVARFLAETERLPVLSIPAGGLSFPERLVSASGTASSPTGALPFAGSGQAYDAVGAWFLDPADYVARIFNFPTTPANLYCWNFFLGRDIRGTREFCTEREPDVPGDE